MTNVAPRGVPALPWVSEFPELNVRTYVRVADEPGIFFFSLDAGSALAVHAARTMLNLPYFTASMVVTPDRDCVRYESRRDGAGADAEFRASYAPEGPTFIASPGSLEYFLTERYCLYNLNHHAEPYRLDIHHRPWPLQQAELDNYHSTMIESHGLPTPAGAPLLHYAEALAVDIWPLGKV